MNTIHKFKTKDTRHKQLKNESIDLVVTSPPYPMIKMWDDIFISMNSKIDLNSPNKAFHLMNLELKKVYKQMYKALKIGGLMIINIGDATRTIHKNFKLYTNAAKTISMCEEIGFDTLPQIHWWKPTNSPNKFMGSGMYPIKAYVTLENEHILIFKKGTRLFNSLNEIKNRKESAFFQNERNIWFSDIWKNIKGESQNVKGLKRKRNGAFPFNIPYRLINMYSVKGDIVVDPFGGTGTTSIAAMASGRNSLSFDIDESFTRYTKKRISKILPSYFNNIINKRISESQSIAVEKINKNPESKIYRNMYGISYTSQETNIHINRIKNIKCNRNSITIDYLN